MASLIEGGHGYLVIQFYYRGRRCREYTGRLATRDNRRALERLAKMIQAEIDLGSFDYHARFPASPMPARLGLVAPPHPATLAAECRRWLALQDLEPESRRDYGYLFQTFVAATALGGLCPAEVTPGAIRAAMAEQSPYRAAKFLPKLRAVFEQLIGDGVLADRNPVLRVKPPRDRRRQRKLVPPWEEAAQRLKLYHAAECYDRALIALVMGNGLRLGEALALRHQDLNLKTGKIIVAAAVYRGREKATKNAGADRVNDLQDDILPVTAALRALPAALRPDRPLFATRGGGFIDLNNWRERHWKRLLARAGEPYREPNALRHSYAVAMLQAGYDPVAVSRQMGHSSTEMVLRRYVRWTSQRLLQTGIKTGII